MQVCTAAMTYGFGIIKELTAGLSLWMDEKGYSRIDEVTVRDEDANWTTHPNNPMAQAAE